MKHVGLQFLFAAFFTLFSGTGAAGRETLTFRKHNVDHGLSDNCVSCIMQDRIGFMWFGTKDGLNRFDGIGYRVYRFNRNDPSSIGCSTVNHIIQDDAPDHSLWVATNTGVYLYSYAEDSFTPLYVATTDGESLSSHITHICQDGTDVFWVATIDRGLFRYDRRDGELLRYTSENTDGELPSDVVRKIFKDNAANIWVATNKGLCRFNRENGHFISYAKPGTFGANEIMSVYEDGKGNIWAGSWAGGLGRFNKKNQQFTTFFTRGSGQYVSHIRAIREYRNGYLFVGSDDGLYLLDTDSQRGWRVDDPDDHVSLSDQNVYDIYQDREGGVWFGTYFGGVNYLRNPMYNNGIAQYHPGSGRNMLSGKAVSRFCEDRHGCIWIATEDQGISCFDPVQKTFTNYKPSAGNSISYHNIHSLLIDDDKLLIGTFSRGLDILDLHSGRFSNYKFDRGNESNFNINSIFDLFKASSGEIYVGTPFGLFVLDRRDYTLTPTGLNGFIRAVTEDFQGNLWVATYFTGAFRRPVGGGEWTNYLPDDRNPRAINHYKLTDVYIDGSQRLWFASEGGGICKYNYRTDDFTTIDESDGLTNNIVYGILDDGQGNIWASTNLGISKIDPETNTVERFSVKDGLQSNQFNYRANLKSSDGLLYFGGINGFNVIDPNQLFVNEVVPPVCISSVTGFEDRSPLANTHTRRIDLKWNRASFIIDVSILSFVYPESNRVVYKLDGRDESWSEVMNMWSFMFHDLAPGRYTFKVRGANNDGIWNDIGDTLDIEVSPPPWGSKIAYLLYVLLLLGLLSAMIYYFARRSEHKRQAQLDNLNREKEREIYENKIHFFTSIAHEIRTPLSLIKAPLEMILNSDHGDASLRSNLAVMDKNTRRLIELVDQLLDFRKIESDKYRFCFTTFDACDVLTQTCCRYEQESRQSGIGIRLTLSDAECMICSDRDAFIKIVGNIIDNGLKYARTYVSVDFRTTTDRVIVAISNDGDPIPHGSIEKIFDLFYRVENEPGYDHTETRPGTGIGLSLVRQLVTNLSGDIRVESDERMTTFTIELPYTADAATTDPAMADAIASGEDLSDSRDGMPEIPETTSRKDEKPHVLVVEDNAELRHFLCESLSDEYRVVAASNGGEAIDQIKKTAIDIVISDVVMPRMDGIALLKYLKGNQLYSHIPVILLSAKTAVTSKIEGLGSGADYYMDKPFSVSHIKAQLKSITENRRRLIEHFTRQPLTVLDPAPDTLHDEFIAKLNRFIDDHIANSDFSIRELASELAVSQSNLQRKIKGVTGLTPHEYIRILRLKHAAKLLASKRYHINEVAYMVGFNTPSYFSKCFAGQFGMLPNEFVRQIAGA